MMEEEIAEELENFVQDDFGARFGGTEFLLGKGRRLDAPEMKEFGHDEERVFVAQTL